MVAYLFLSDGLDPIDVTTPPQSSHHEIAITTQGMDNNNERGGDRERGEIDKESRSVVAEKNENNILWEARLRQYFKFCIETDESALGQGFRAAARAYAQLGLEELLYYVALNHEFPLICD